MANRAQIVEILQEYGLDFKEKNRTLTGVPCPICQREDKFSILKANGYTICYRSSCEYGKRDFVGFVQAVAGISFEEALEKLKGERDENDVGDLLKEGLGLKIELVDPFEDDDEMDMSILSDLTPVKYPDWHMVPITSPEGYDGLKYLEGRGITKEMAQNLEITFSPFYQRVYLPIKMNDVFYGYQGRAIRKVEDKDRIRNNEGFHRETLVMFLDNLKYSKDAIISEGPFDGMKFELVGGYVSTLGKEITDKQIQLIMSYEPERIFLALDDDAAYEMMLLLEKIQKPIYKLNVPDSCRERCKANGKKADFGECTLEEAKYAKENAVLLGKQSLLVHLK